MNIRGIGQWVLSILFIMVGIYVIKWAAAKWNIPGVSTLAASV